MEYLTEKFLVGSWFHNEWKCELTPYRFLVIEWPIKVRAFGSWFLRDHDVVLTYVQEGLRVPDIYIFSIEEIIDDNTIKTRDISSNKVEILKRQ